MHFKLLAYTLVSALWIEAAPTHRGHKRVDLTIYDSCLQRGTAILQGIEGIVLQASSADTPGLTAKYNTLYAPFTKDSIIGSGTSQFGEIQEVIVTPAISKLVQLTVTRSGTDRQPAYTNYFDVANGIIVGVDNFNVKFFYMAGEHGTSTSDPVRTAANSLQWNALVGEQYKTLGGNLLGQLQHILRYHILNQDTLDVMQAAVNMQTLPVTADGWTVVQPGTPGSAGDNMFRALLGTENGRGAGYMLKDYRSSMQGKAIQSIRIQCEDQDCGFMGNMIFDF